MRRKHNNQESKSETITQSSTYFTKSADMFSYQEHFGIKKLIAIKSNLNLGVNYSPNVWLQRKLRENKRMHHFESIAPHCKGFSFPSSRRNKKKVKIFNSPTFSYIFSQIPNKPRPLPEILTVQTRISTNTLYSSFVSEFTNNS